MQDQVTGILPALPEIFLGCAAMALLLFGVFRGDGATRLISWLSVAALAIAGVGVVLLTPAGGHHLLFSGLFVADSFAVFVKVLVLAASAISIIMAVGYNEREGMARFEFPILCVLATLGMMMMISANDLIALYLGLELQSLALYVVAAFRRDSLKSTEAGLKYFVLGALASGMLLYGASMVYGFAGSTGFAELAAHFQAAGTATLGVIVGIVFLIVGLAFKVAAFPFHMWTPDVYEGAPTPVTAFFASAPKLAAMALFLRVMASPFVDLTASWQQIIWFLSVGSMILGSFAAIRQRNIKRLLAYSAIGQIGFALIGLASGTPVGISSVLIYMAIYIVMTIGAFCVVLCMKRNGRMVEDIGDLAGLAKTHPMMALAMGIFMFSMAGIPPLAGFFGKLYVFLAAIEAGQVALAVIGVLSSVVAAYYYLNIVKIMYFDDAGEVLDRGIGRAMAAIQAVTGVLIALFFLYPGPLISGAEAAVKSLAGS